MKRIMKSKNITILVFFVAFLSMGMGKCREKKAEPVSVNKDSKSATFTNITGKQAAKFENISAKIANMPKLNFYLVKDPFYTALIETKVKQAKAAKVRTSPTQKFEIEKYNLVGVIIDKKSKSAIFEDPDGKGWVVKEGTPIGTENAKVKKISVEGVVVEDIVYEAGKPKPREIFMPIKKVK
jgi:Tfp pilus assembly protein PilP